MAKQNKETDARDEVMKYLNADDRSLFWLSRKSGLNYNTLYGSLVRKRFLLSESKKKKINKAIGINFFS